MSSLQDKIDHSIALIKKTEKLALAMSDEGFHVGFSGGKDSQVLLELVKMAGVRYKAVYNVTTNDPVENVRFIKEKYPDVIFDRPKESFFQLVAKKGLPTQLMRFCCAILKEKAGIGKVVLTGVRAEESAKRAQYDEIKKWGRDRGETIDLDKMEQAHFQCVGGKDKFMVYPILRWTEQDVWRFLRERELPINPCYASQRRVGCVFCPFAPKKQIMRHIKEKPKQYQALLHNLQKFIDQTHEKGLISHFDTAEEYFQWWVEKESIKTYKEKKQQTTIQFDYEEDNVQRQARTDASRARRPQDHDAANHPNQANTKVWTQQIQRPNL